MKSFAPGLELYLGAQSRGVYIRNKALDLHEYVSLCLATKLPSTPAIGPTKAQNTWKLSLANQFSLRAMIYARSG